MKRPEIKDHFPKGTTLDAVVFEYNSCKSLFKYAQAVDKYCDQLEQEDITNNELTTLKEAVKELREEQADKPINNYYILYVSHQIYDKILALLMK